MGSQSKPETNAAIQGGAVDILRQGETLLNAVDDDQYAQIVEPAFRASIGAHYRHCLEYFQLLLDGANDGEVDYDRRQRDVLIETDRFAALNLTRDLIGRIEDLDDGALDGEIKAVSKLGYSDEASRRVNSSFARELMYAISHGVHHYALISVMARLAGIGLPEHFGEAPSTVAYQREEARARPLNAVPS
jgi:uncharacterized damage-inducible protein DinB